MASELISPLLLTRAQSSQIESQRARGNSGARSPRRSSTSRLRTARMGRPHSPTGIRRAGLWPLPAKEIGPTSDRPPFRRVGKTRNGRRRLTRALAEQQSREGARSCRSPTAPHGVPPRSPPIVPPPLRSDSHPPPPFSQQQPSAMSDDEGSDNGEPVRNAENTDDARSGAADLHARLALSRAHSLRSVPITPLL